MSRYFNNIWFLILLTVALTIVVGCASSPAVEELQASYIVQGTNPTMAADAVRSVGGEITHELGVIRAVGARLTPSQTEQLKELGLKVHENRSLRTSSVAPITSEPTLRFDKNKLMWNLTNNGSATVTISRIEVAWPAANQMLKKIKFGKDIYTVASPPPSLVVDSGWRGNTSDRSIDPGKTKELKLEFEKNTVTDDSQYMLLIDFTDGSSVGFNLPQPTPTPPPPTPPPVKPPPRATNPPIGQWPCTPLTAIGFVFVTPFGPHS